MRPGLSRGLLCALALASACLLPGLARAQFRFDASNYTALADAGSVENIPVGTRITLRNWQQYRKFMPVAFVAAYSQHYGFKIGEDPRYAINVGPAIAVPMFKQLLYNTEKYAGQTPLMQTASGGFTIH